MQNFVKVRPVGAELSHAGGRADRDMVKFVVAFRNFAIAPKKICKTCSTSVPLPATVHHFAITVVPRSFRLKWGRRGMDYPGWGRRGTGYPGIRIAEEETPWYRQHTKKSSNKGKL
jgi:hypothetical protein